MREFGFRIGPAQGLHPAAIPDRSLSYNRSPMRRLDDAMVAVFERACDGNDLDAAANVMELLFSWHETRSATYGCERRIDDNHLRQMAAKLKRLSDVRRV